MYIAMTAGLLSSSPHTCVYNYCMLLLYQVYVFEGMSKNVTSVGFYQNAQFMFSGGEDCMARIWDLRYI